MRSKFAAALAALAAFALVAFAVSAAAKPNFAGTWVLDTSKTEGERPGVTETMTVTQDGDKITVERKLTTPRGDRTSNDTYTADGKEGEYTRQFGQNSVKGKRTVKWSADGAALEITDKSDFQTPDGNAVSMTTTSKWTLSGDGKTLTVESSSTGGPRGPQSSKRVYTKQ